MTTLLIAAAGLIIFGATKLLFLSSHRNDVQFVDESKVLNRGLVGEPESLDPHRFSSDQAAEVLRDTREGLVAIDADGELTPGVAEYWEVSNDGLKYSFRIRPDAVWSNGRKITAHDFVATYHSLVDPWNAATNANALVVLENAEEIISGDVDVKSLGVAAPSNDLLEINLHSPTPYFLQLLTHPSLYPKYYHEVADERESRLIDISNGAYILEDWSKGSEITLRKNPRYWAHKSVFFDVVRYHIVDEGTEFNRFRAREIDVTGTVASGIFSAAQRDYTSQLKVSPKLGIYYYGFNLSNPKFSENLNIRRALSLAIDRELLVEKILSRGEQPAFGWVPPGTSNYESKSLAELKLGKKQRELKAKHYYEAAGYGSSKRLEFQLRYNDSDVQQRIALAISAMWRDVLGVEVELVSEEFQVLLSNIREKDVTEVFRLSWTGDYNDAQSFLDLFESGHPQNLTGYSNSNFDKLIRAASVEVDLVARRMLLESAEYLALSEHPVIPLYFYVSKHLVSDQIAGWNPNILDVHRSQHLRRRP